MPAQLLLAYRESRSTLRVIADAGADYGEGAMTIWMPVEPEANELLSRSPLALVIALLLDQQVTLEKAFAGRGLHYLADLPNTEIARALGITTTTVRVHLMQGRRGLRDLLGDPDA